MHSGTKTFNTLKDYQQVGELAEKVKEVGLTRLAAVLDSIREFGRLRGYITEKQSNLVLKAHMQLVNPPPKPKAFTPKVITRKRVFVNHI